MFPEDIETITMTKEDYDRNVEQLLVEKLELEHKYNLMKKNAYQLAMRIDEAINYITEEITKGTDVYCEEKVDGIIVLEILKGSDKE